MRRFNSISRLLAVSAGLFAPVAMGQALQREIERAIGAASLNESASTGVFILDTSTTEILATQNAQDPFIPASNAKLLTSAAAMRVLGADFSFRTHLLLDDSGRVTVVGSGDPGLGDPDILAQTVPPTNVDDMLATLAQAIAAKQPEQISEIVIDDRVFERQTIHPMWPTDQLERQYCAPVAGVNFHRNIVQITPRPSPRGPGNAATAWMEPRADWIQLRIEAMTVGEGQNTFRVDRDALAETFTLRGKIRQPSTIAAEVTIPRPARHFGALLAQAIEDLDIEVGEQHRSVFEEVRLVEQDADQPEGEIVAWIDTPLANVAERSNTDSANLYAEAMLKRTGHAMTRSQGSWANGAAAIRMQLAELVGPDHAASTIISDGSGLSRENRVRPDTLAYWLDSAADDEAIRDAFFASLPAPGEGTLRNRFRSERPANLVLAKTGTINGVSGLSGYVVHEPTGHAIAFVVLNNGLRGARETRAARAMQEEIVLSIDRYLTEIMPAQADVGNEAHFGG